MTSRDFFDVELEWAQRGSGFVLRSDDRGPLAQACRRAAEGRLFRPQGLIDADTVVSEGLPFWTLLHLNADPHGSMWCFVEQGRGGCRASLLEFGRHHPAEVWQAGQELARTRSARGELNVPLARAVLAAVAADEHRIRLPAGAENNAELIGAVLALLPRRVASSWVWSTHLFGTADRFVAGRLGEPALQAAAVRQFAGPLEFLAAELGRWTGPATQAARESRAERLAEFLQRLGPHQAGAVAVAGGRAVEAAAAGPPAGPPARPDRRAPAPQPPAEEPSERTQRLPSPADLTQGAALELVWAEWATVGTGFERLGGPAEQARLRRFFAAAEPLLAVEKVPNGVEATLQYPLWTLRWVNVDGVGTQWCFVERGRGNLVGVDGRLALDRQFGMAGGCRFGFAPFGERPVDVWAAGEAERWTPTDEMEGPASARAEVLRRLFAALGDGQARVCLPGDPAENRLLIAAALAVLPGPLVARWIWSTCLFEPVGWYVAGAAPADLHGSESVALLARQVAANRLPAAPDGYLAELGGKQREAFAWLVKWAVRAMNGQSIQKAFLQLVRRSTAAGLTEFLTEIANTIKLSERKPEEVQTALLSRDGRQSLHNNDADAVTLYAERSPDAAHRHLAAQPESEVRTEMLDGLRNRQLQHPEENVFGLPTAGSKLSSRTSQTVTLLLRHSDEAGRAQLVQAAIRPGGFLNDWRNLAAAEPVVRQFGLTWEEYPQYYPARIVEELLERPTIDDVTELGLRRSPDAVQLLRVAVGRTKRMTESKAAQIMLLLYQLTGGSAANSTLLREFADAMIATRSKRERLDFWAAVMNRYSLGAVSDVRRAAVFAAGVTALLERNRNAPLRNNALFKLNETIGSTATEPIEPEREPFRLGEWWQGVRDRRAQRRQATRRPRINMLLVLVIAFVLVIAGVAYDSALHSGDPAGDTQSPGAPAPASPSEVPGSGSAGATPPTSIPPPGRNGPAPTVNGRRSTAR